MFHLIESNKYRSQTLGSFRRIWSGSPVQKESLNSFMKYVCSCKSGTIVDWSSTWWNNRIDWNEKTLSVAVWNVNVQNCILRLSAWNIRYLLAFVVGYWRIGVWSVPIQRASRVNRTKKKTSAVIQQCVQMKVICVSCEILYKMLSSYVWSYISVFTWRL